MSRRTKRRMRCPRCSGKKFKDKTISFWRFKSSSKMETKRQIWVCLNTECNYEFEYIPHSREYIEILHSVANTPEPRMIDQTETQVQTAEPHTQPIKGSLEEMAKDLGF